MGLRLPRTKAILRREARSWLVRLQSGRDPNARAKFRTWYEADPSHAAAFESVQRNFDRAALLRASPASRDRELQPQRPSVPDGRGYAWAAAAALAVLVPAGWLVIDRLVTAGTNAVMLDTRVGEIKRVDLEDGSKLILDTATSVEVDVRQSRRLARVTRGRARFDVAAAGAPFIVEAGGTTVKAHEAVFDVSNGGARSAVVVLSGSAEVRNSQGRTESGQILKGGDAVSAGDEGIAPVRTAAAATDWPSGMLQFDRTELAAAIALANRYSSQKIAIDPKLRQLRVTGVFRAGDTAALAKALAAAFGLSVTRTADGLLTLSPKRQADIRQKNGG